MRTVADGCGRLRTVADVNQRPANTALPPHPQSETGTLATHSGKKLDRSATRRTSTGLFPLHPTGSAFYLLRMEFVCQINKLVTNQCHLVKQSSTQHLADVKCHWLTSSKTQSLSNIKALTRDPKSNRATNLQRQVEIGHLWVNRLVNS